MHPQHLQRRVAWSLYITVCIALVEGLGGLLSNSLALLGDAGHVGADAAALLLALAAMKISARPHTPTLTYGYHRVEVVAALINGLSLFAVAGYVLSEAYVRFLNPPRVSGQLLLITAFIGLIANLVVAFLLKEGRRVSINVKGAFLHVVGDVLSSIGVVLGGFAILVSGFLIVDAVVAVFIAILLLRGGALLVRDASGILLEQAPRGVDVKEAFDEMLKVEGVRSVHDLHVWSITSGMYVMSVHVVVDEHSRDHDVIQALNRMLKDKFNIAHITVQVDHAAKGEKLLDVDLHDKFQS